MAQSSAEVPMQDATSTYGNLSASCNDFTSAFYKELVTMKSGNIVMSPLSIHMTLSLLSQGAKGTTLQELTTNLYHRDIESFNKEIQSLILLLKEVKNVKLYLANSLYIQDGFDVLPDFLSINNDIFLSEISNLNFENNVHAAEKINSWVKQATENKIDNLVLPAYFDEYTRLVLASAIYFKGNWLHEFDVKNTENRIFHSTKTTTKLVPTMFRKASYNYGELPELNSSFIEIPYLNRDIVMIIILPNETDGLSFLQNNFKWATLASAARDNYNMIELYLPKFKFEVAVDLEDTLRKMGLKLMFEEAADFGRIANERLVVSKVLHKAMIEVNEAGTEAAAATATIVRLCRMIINEPQKFEVNHPFMFVIEHKPSKLPLFLGNVWDIETTRERDEL